MDHHPLPSAARNRPGAPRGGRRPAGRGPGDAGRLRAGGRLRERTQGKVFRDRVDPHWFADGDRFWYRNDLAGGAREFVVVDAAGASGRRPSTTRSSRRRSRRRPGSRSTADSPAVRLASQVDGRRHGPVRGRRQGLALRPEADAARQGRRRRAAGRRGRPAPTARARRRTAAAGLAPRRRVARRQVGRLRQGPRPLPPRQGVRRGVRAQRRRDRGRRLRGRRLLVARLEEARRPADREGGRPQGLPDRVVAQGPAPAEAPVVRLPQARRPRPGLEAAPVRRRRAQGNPGRRRPVPEPLEHRATSAGRPTRRGSPSSTTSAAIRSSGSSRSTRRRARRRPSIDEKSQTFVDYSQQDVPPLPRRDGRDPLDVGARRLEPPLPVSTRRPGAVKNQITQGRMGRPRRRPGRRGEAAGLVPRRRHPARAGPVSRPLRPGELRRHRPRRPDRGGRHARGRVLARPAVPDRHLLAGGPAAGRRAAARPTDGTLVCELERADDSALRRDGLEGRPSGSSPRAATARPTSTA